MSIDCSIVISFSLVSGFQAQALLDALVDGRLDKLIESENFTRALNKRIEVLGQDSIDVQPVIRKLMFDVVYGEFTSSPKIDVTINVIAT